MKSTDMSTVPGNNIAKVNDVAHTFPAPNFVTMLFSEHTSYLQFADNLYLKTQPYHPKIDMT